MAGLTLFALLLMAPAAGASTFGMSGSTPVFSGDASADRVQLMRYDDTQNGVSWYLVTDDGGITPQSPCVRVSSTMAGCRLTAGRGYQLNTGGGADTVTIAAGVPTGTTDLGPGDDTFTGQAAADIVHGGDGNDTLRGAARQRPALRRRRQRPRGRPDRQRHRRRRRGRRPARVRRRRPCPPTRAPAPTTSAAARARTA